MQTEHTYTQIHIEKHTNTHTPNTNIDIYTQKNIHPYKQIYTQSHEHLQNTLKLPHTYMCTYVHTHTFGRIPAF